MAKRMRPYWYRVDEVKRKKGPGVVLIVDWTGIKQPKGPSSHDPIHTSIKKFSIG